MTTAQKFQEKMNKLSNDQIISLINMTWNEPTGGMFREYGFDILTDRLGEDEADAIYANLWNANR